MSKNVKCSNKQDSWDCKSLLSTVFVFLVSPMLPPHFGGLALLGGLCWGLSWSQDSAVHVCHSWMSPDRRCVPLQVMVNRRARGWTIAVLGREGRQARAAEGLYKWISANGFGFTRDETKRSDSLVKEVCELAGSTEDFYRSFPFLHEGHPFFELGRLYPSLVATADDGRVFLSNFGVASDPHTYHALGIHYVVNCSRDLPFVDDVVSTLRSKPRDKSSSMLPGMCVDAYVKRGPLKSTIELRLLQFQPALECRSSS